MQGATLVVARPDLVVARPDLVVARVAGVHNSGTGRHKDGRYTWPRDDSVRRPVAYSATTATSVIENHHQTVGSRSP